MNANFSSASGADSKPFDIHQSLTPRVLEKAMLNGHMPAMGTLQAQDCPRLSESVLEVLEPVRWEFGPQARASVKAQPRRRWWLSARARLKCRCERCLEPVEILVLGHRGFEFFESARDADIQTEQALAEEQEGGDEFSNIDFLSPEDGVTLLALIEDELLLSLPASPRHEDCPLAKASRGQAATAAGQEGEQTIRPFAGLKDLLKKN